MPSPTYYNRVHNYYKGQWKEYSLHDQDNIKGFFGEYRFLSNFPNCENGVFIDGLRYDNLEAAYQAQKVIPEHRNLFCHVTGAQSKKLWLSPTLVKANTPEQWDAIKSDIMAMALFDKFYRNLDLRHKLLDTGNRYLEERNNWHDNFFGNCICKECGSTGKNELGKLLMKVREFWK